MKYLLIILKYAKGTITSTADIFDYLNSSFASIIFVNVNNNIHEISLYFAWVDVE